MRKLTDAQRRQFLAARDELVAGLRHQPPHFAARLRVKRVRGTTDVWEITWAADGRATFRYGDEIVSGTLTWSGCASDLTRSSTIRRDGDGGRWSFVLGVNATGAVQID